jgi:ATP-dependent DNA helicase DinG
MVEVLDRSRLPNRSLNPLLATLPPWVSTIRPHQVRAIRQIMAAYDDGVRLVFLDAPTGSGKTLIAEVVRRLLRARAIYVCTTKSLQKQVLADFGDTHKVVMGRANYPTVLLSDQFPDVTAEDCTISSGSCQLCPEKDDCPYTIAKTEAMVSDVAVLNAAYLLSESRSERSGFAGRPLMVLDEADTVESELMRFVSVSISERRMSRWGWSPPAKVTVVESWGEWLMEAIANLDVIQRQHRHQGGDRIAWQREGRYLSKTKAALGEVLAGLDTGVWVYTGKEGQGVSFKPSRVDLLGENLWKITDGRWLLMSATPISVEERLDSLGWEGPSRTVRVESTFPVENRRVRYMPVGSMGNKKKDVTIGNLARAVEDICLNHPHDRVLVHTVSYRNTEEIRGRIRHKLAPRPVLTYATARDREMVLDNYLRKDAAILLAPSMERGIDLPGDACRVQIITKVPYPYLGDRQVSARLHSQGGNTWYLCETIRALVQMCGRAIRSAEDWAETWVLDEDFDSLWTRGRGLFPKWFAESIVWRPEEFDV